MLFAGRTIQLRRRQVNALTIGGRGKGSAALLEIAVFAEVNLWILLVLLRVLPTSLKEPVRQFDVRLFDSAALRWVGLGAVAVGFLVFVLALARLNDAWRVGIPDQAPKRLVTDGIYAWSRNPIYLFFNLFFLGTFLIQGSLALLALALVNAVLLHLEARREERYLARVFGTEFEEYRIRVPFYLGLSPITRRQRGGVLAFVGFLLSPLSWWNDLVINLPLAYAFALPFSLLSRKLFLPMMILGYWLTNVLGLVLMTRGVAAAAGPVQSSAPGSRPRGLLLNLGVALLYTVLVAGLAWAGVLKPPAFLKRQAASNPVHFAREEIDVRISPGRVEVLGNYHFRNTLTQPSRAVMFYPFPLDSSHDYPDSIAVPGYEFTRRDSGIEFEFRFRPGQEDSFRVFYRQMLRRNVARYIVTTTRQWQRPIDEARFRVLVPADFQQVELSYRAEQVERGESVAVYSFARRRFYPDRDVVVTWRRP